MLAIPACLILISACSTAGNDDGGDDTGGSSDERVIEHAFGETKIEGEPERVASVGFREHDALLALGVQPVMVHQWYSEYSTGLGPWAEPHLDGNEPTVIPATASELPFEEIATEEPDLIVALDAGIDQETYDKLSEIAPTIANPEGAAPYAVPYGQETEMIGDAVGKTDEAGKLVEDTDAAFEEVRSDHPEFEGKTAAVGCPMENGGFALYPSTDPRGEFLTNIGFTVPEEIDEAASGDYYADISAENVSMIANYDFLLIIDDCGDPTVDLDDHETFHSLDITKRGDYVYGTSADAISHNTVLSVPYAIDELVPEIEETL